MDIFDFFIKGSFENFSINENLKNSIKEFFNSQLNDIFEIIL